MDEYQKMLEEGFLWIGQDYKPSRLEFLADHIFDFTTYDSKKSELFAAKALEVAEAVSNGATFAYIEDELNYQWFLLMVNTPFFIDRIEWGTSVRGAWWRHDEHVLNCCGLWRDEEQLTEMKFTRDEWIEFVAAMRKFIGAAT